MSSFWGVCGLLARAAECAMKKNGHHPLPFVGGGGLALRSGANGDLASYFPIGGAEPMCDVVSREGL